MSSVATYPGAISPLRGLVPFTEAEREVFYGRDDERDAIVRLVTGEGFRAGLLYGPVGVGKTSLLRAGVAPHLRDHGITALFCEDGRNPAYSLAQSLVNATGMGAAEGEDAMSFVTRAVEQSMAGQMFVFLLDDVETMLQGSPESRAEIRDLYTRLVTRAGGRARFLFSCASDSVHLFSSLERRTGSLFPPSNRHELRPFPVEAAALVLDRTLALTGVAADPHLARVVAESLARKSGVLPADLQIAALAMRELKVDSAAALARVGGPGDLERSWLRTCAAATGNERGVMRLLAEISDDATPYAPEWAAARASVNPAFAARAFEILQQKQVLKVVPVVESPTPHYQLVHPLLAGRVRDLTAPARASARRAFELIGSKVPEGRRLSIREYLEVRREGLAPATPDERAVITRTERLYKIVGASVLAAPIVFLLLIYVLLSGHYYLDVASPRGADGPERIVVREGRPGLSAFHWLPGSFGEIVADTGFSRGMVKPVQWRSIRDLDVTGDLDGDYAARALAALDPRLEALIAYVTTGENEAFEQLRGGVEGPDDLVELLEAIQLAARGTDAEVDLVETALRDPSPAVQTTALGVAAAAAKHADNPYRQTLARALTSPDDELRRLAFTTVRSLGPEIANELFRDALTLEPEPDARRDLLAVVTASSAAAEKPSAASAASILINRDIPAGLRTRARELLRRAFSSDPKVAAEAAAKLAAEDKAPPEDRVFALELIRERAPDESFEPIAADVKAALDSSVETVRTAALPAYAQVQPKDAARQLALLEDQKLGDALREAKALAWGEVARATRDSAATVALERMLTDSVPSVRAAAARAYGNVGRASQSQLSKMVRTERFDVALGAAYGLANSAEVGASASVAVGGIAQLWKRKGRSRREAAVVFARLARTKSRNVIDYLASATRDKQDRGLHKIGAEGICNAAVAGNRPARRTLTRVADDEDADVRRVAIQCVADNPGDDTTAAAVAVKLAGDVDSEIRADAARVLAGLAGKGKVPRSVGPSLLKLARDDDREVRVIAIRALAQLAGEAPEGTNAALVRAFERAGEEDKLMLLEAARQVGAAELVGMATGDDAAAVRIAAIDTAIATSADAAATLNAALTDGDRAVRRAALVRLAAERDKLDGEAIEKALELAVRDPDSSIAELALATTAQLGEIDGVKRRLGSALTARSERDRVRAAAACAGLVERDPELAIELLEPLLVDPSHDVRAAMLPALAAAYAQKNTPEALAAMLRRSERHAMRRLVVVAAFVVLARTPAGSEAASAALGEIAKRGQPMARLSARLGLGLLDGPADAIGFLQSLAP